MAIKSEPTMWQFIDYEFVKVIPVVIGQWRREVRGIRTVMLARLLVLKIEEPRIHR